MALGPTSESTDRAQYDERLTDALAVAFKMRGVALGRGNLRLSPALQALSARPSTRAFAEVQNEEQVAHSPRFERV
jgi:hypothetical protein